MKLSPDAVARAAAWSPSTLEDQPGSRAGFPPPRARPAGPALAESLFAPALADELSPHEGPPDPGLPPAEGAPFPFAETPHPGWLSDASGRGRMMEDCCEHWIPAEFTYEPLGADSAPATLNVETIREAALSVAREAVLETMRQEAARVLEEARRQAAEATLEARRQADEALQCARRQGLEQARAQAENTLQMLAEMVSETQAWQENLLRRSERLALMLVKDIAARLFGDGFVLDPAILGLAFERALVEAKSLGDLRLRAHPEDLAMLGELWPAHQTALRGQRIELIPDVDIRRGGCWIEGQFGSVDGRVDTQLRLVQTRLDEELADSERPENAFTPLTPEELAQ